MQPPNNHKDVRDVYDEEIEAWIQRWVTQQKEQQQKEQQQDQQKEQENLQSYSTSTDVRVSMRVIVFRIIIPNSVSCKTELLFLKTYFSIPDNSSSNNAEKINQIRPEL